MLPKTWNQNFRIWSSWWGVWHARTGFTLIPQSVSLAHSRHSGAFYWECFPRKYWNGLSRSGFKRNGLYSALAAGTCARKIKDYPEYTMFDELPSWGFYVRHVRGLTMKNMKLKLDDADYRPAFMLDDVQNIMMDEVDVPSDKKAQIVLKNTYKISSTRPNCTFKS